VALPRHGERLALRTTRSLVRSLCLSLQAGSRQGGFQTGATGGSGPSGGLIQVSGYSISTAWRTSEAQPTRWPAFNYPLTSCFPCFPGPSIGNQQSWQSSWYMMRPLVFGADRTNISPMCLADQPRCRHHSSHSKRFVCAKIY
jgi:hypothetical protein